MKENLRWFLGMFLLGAAARAADLPPVIPLWPGAAPGSEHLAITEKITERSTDPQKHDRIYTQIAIPSLKVYRPSAPNGVAVIVAPGGGYMRIVIDKEGPDTAAWLNGLGVTVFVLKYRLPGEGHANGSDVALEDAQRAVRIIRAHAVQWGLDPRRVGFLGYSAGGHLAASVEFFAQRQVYPPVDTADTLSAQPDFSILCYAPSGSETVNAAGYPVLQGVLTKYRIAADPAVHYPPTFILQAEDDPLVDPKNATALYAAFRKAQTPVELHIFLHGGHGFGIRDAHGALARWPDLCAAWMREIGVLQ